MFLRLVLLFTVVPLVELYLLITIGRILGAVATLLLVLVTGILGAGLARQQGLQTFAQVQGEMAAGRMPTAALLDGLMILIAGAVLLTPGLLTDLFGFFLLLPPGRRLVREAVAARFRRAFARPGNARVVIINPPGDAVDSPEDHLR